MSALTVTTWMNGSRSRRIAHMLVCLWVLNLSDLLFTLWAHQYTPFIEVNPIGAALLGMGLIDSLVLYKLTVTMIGSLIFWRLRENWRTEAGLWFVLFIYTLLTLRWSNYTVAAASEICFHPC